jgi:glycosyltransferase involved in cell wall biosynthesis
MRITFLMPSLSFAGGNRVVAIYADRLQRRGHRVVVVVPPPAPSDLSGRLLAWLDSDTPRRRALANRPPSHFDGIEAEVRFAARPGRIDADDVPDADVVIATWWETAEWAQALPPSKGAHAYFVQHHEVFDYLPVERARRTYTAPLHRIAIAQWLVDVLASEYGDHDVDLVPNAVDHAQFHAPPRTRQDRPTVGFMNSKASFKGVDVTLAALLRLRDELPELRILSFGLCPPDNLGELAPVVRYQRMPPQESIRAVYSECDVWLTASRSEGFNLPAMEAMACRTPVVATRTGWPLEAIVDGVNGYLVPVDDAQALSAHALRVLRMAPPEWQRMSEQAHATAAPHSWDRSTEMFERALERAVAKQTARRRGGVAVQAA